MLAAMLIAAPVAAHADDATPAPTTGAPGGEGRASRDGDGIPDQLSREDRAKYRSVFAAIRAGRWDEAQATLDAMRPGILHPIARAELYTAKGSPKVALAPLMALLADAPELPQAPQIARMAKSRGAETLPALPDERRLVWYSAAPVRQRARSVKSDSASAEIALAIQPFIKADDGAQAEALIQRYLPDLTPDAATEWQQKVAWIYFIAGDDQNARRVAAMAQAGTGDWAAQADWVQGLAAWRLKDCEAAGAAFESVARRAEDSELRSAGMFWAARADIACGHPERVSAHLNGAAQYGETFYGLLARESLGIEDKPDRGEIFLAEDWRTLERRSNVRVAAALTEVGENNLADEVLKYQAKIGAPEEHGALTRLAGRLNLPSTQLWLTHYCPPGTRPQTAARYPKPSWMPEGGWRVDKALVFAHTLQESKFDTDVRSPAGALGLMQVKLGAATDVGRKRGVVYASADLVNPAVNMEVGQSYLEQLRDQPSTGGLLPKVIAAYNAGPTPVGAWNALSKDNGDPLLYIESIPYWETRGYVMTVLRNYWMYEAQEGRPSPSRAALAQGLWPKFPGMPGPQAVKLGASGAATPVTLHLNKD